MAGETIRVGLAVYMAGMRQALDNWPAILSSDGVYQEAERFLDAMEAMHGGLSETDKERMRHWYLTGWGAAIQLIRDMDVSIYQEERYGRK
jgi:hypothetical protein